MGQPRRRTGLLRSLIPAAGEVDFVSDDPSGPRYRLRYLKTGPGLQGSFEVAPANARDSFQPYLAGTATRRR